MKNYHWLLILQTEQQIDKDKPFLVCFVLFVDCLLVEILLGVIFLVLLLNSEFGIRCSRIVERKENDRLTIWVLLRLFFSYGWCFVFVFVHKCKGSVINSFCFSFCATVLLVLRLWKLFFLLEWLEWRKSAVLLYFHKLKEEKKLILNKEFRFEKSFPISIIFSWIYCKIVNQPVFIKLNPPWIHLRNWFKFYNKKFVIYENRIWASEKRSKWILRIYYELEYFWSETRWNDTIKKYLLRQKKLVEISILSFN